MIRVEDVPGTGAAQLGNLRRVDAVLCVADGYSPGADPARDLEQLSLELLWQTAITSRRGWSGCERRRSPGTHDSRTEAAALEALLAHLDSGGDLSDFAGEVPGESSR